MESRILYLMTQKEVERLLSGMPAATVARALSSMIRCEVWRGLPPYGFESARCTGGRPALRADKSDVYAWVPSDTVAALRADQDCLLFALGIRRPGCLHVFWVEAVPAHVTRNEAVRKAETFNGDALRSFARRLLAA